MVILDSNLIIKTDCKIRKGQCIGPVNKFISNFQHLQGNVLDTVAPFMDNLFGNANQRFLKNGPRVGTLLYARYQTTCLNQRTVGS